MDPVKRNNSSASDSLQTTLASQFRSGYPNGDDESLIHLQSIDFMGQLQTFKDLVTLPYNDNDATFALHRMDNMLLIEQVPTNFAEAAQLDPVVGRITAGRTNLQVPTGSDKLLSTIMDGIQETSAPHCFQLNEVPAPSSNASTATAITTRTPSSQPNTSSMRTLSGDSDAHVDPMQRDVRGSPTTIGNER
jgi:hypothetical protein